MLKFLFTLTFLSIVQTSVPGDMMLHLTSVNRTSGYLTSLVEVAHSQPKGNNAPFYSKAPWPLDLRELTFIPAAYYYILFFTYVTDMLLGMRNSLS